jgi:hypothetical protein
MPALKKINFNDLASTYEPIPDGEYEIKLHDLEPAVSGAGNDMLIVTYAITKGPHKGSETRQWYSLKVGQSKTGKVTCMGLSTMASIYKAIGVPESHYAELSPDKVEAGRLFQKLVSGKTLDAFIKTEPREDDANKTKSVVKILGLANGSTATFEDEEEIAY